MAGNLKPEEARRALETLRGLNRTLDSCLESLEDNQKMLKKSTQCQEFMNHSVKPIQAGFSVQQNVSGGMHAAVQMSDAEQ